MELRLFIFGSNGITNFHFGPTWNYEFSFWVKLGIATRIKHRRPPCGSARRRRSAARALASGRETLPDHPRDAMSDRRRGVLLVVAAMAAFSLMPVFSRYAVTASTSGTTPRCLRGGDLATLRGHARGRDLVKTKRPFERNPMVTTRGGETCLWSSG